MSPVDSICRHGFTAHCPECHAGNTVKPQAKESAALAAAEAAARKSEALASMLITSGFSFDGFTVTKYSGYISGDDVARIDRGAIDTFSRDVNVVNLERALSRALVEIRRQALLELKEAAYDLGCNAVIGVDFDYITLEPEVQEGLNDEGLEGGEVLLLPYVICVTANGNAVVIERNDTLASVVSRGLES